jgi:hypothetical protein
MQQIERLYYNYTPAALEDKLVELLSCKNDSDVILDEDGNWYIHVFHPYLNQAEGLIYSINVSDPLSKFVIWSGDIPLDLAEALKQLGKVKMKRVITNAVRRIYESIDPEYYHMNGIYGKVKWRFGSSRK